MPNEQREAKNLLLDECPTMDDYSPENRTAEQREAEEAVAKTREYHRGRKEEPMEELQKTLVAQVGKQLEEKSPNIQYLDVLNRLLGTVNNCLISQK